MNATAPTTPALVAVPLEQIELGKNYRHRRPANWEDKLAELGESMKQSGQLEPVLVRPAEPEEEGGAYQIVFGERRYRAATKAGLATLLCIVRDIPDDLVLETQVEENNQREDPHPLDEAEGFAELVKRGRTPAEIAAKLGRDIGYVTKRLTLCQLVPAATKALDEEKITFGVALLLARIPDKKLQTEALEEINDSSWDGLMRVDEARQLIEDGYMLRLEDAPFDTASAELVKKAGPCTTCPKRTGAQAELFADIKSKDLCTDRACYTSKVEAVWQIRKKEAAAGGQPVLEGKAAKDAVQRGSKFRKLTDEEFIGNKHHSIKKLLGKDLPPVTLARVDQHGVSEIVELVPAADVNKVIRAKKGERDEELRGREKSYDQREKQRERAQKLRRQAIRLAIEQAVGKAAKADQGDVFELVVRAFAARVWNEVQVRIVERRGIKVRGGVEAALLKLVRDARTPAELQGLALELALWSGAPWHSGAGTSGPSELWRDGLKLVGVNFEAIEKSVAAQAKEAKKPKAKKVAKKKGQKA